MNEDRQIEKALRRVYGPVDRKGVWESIEKRATQSRPARPEPTGPRHTTRRARPRRVRLAVFAAVVLVVVVGIAVGTTVGLDGGPVVFGTDDGSEGHWEKLPLAQRGAEVWMLLIDRDDRDTLYGATQDGVVRSRDGSASWERVLSMGRGFYSLATIPGSPDSLLVIAHPFSSIDRGGQIASRLMWSDDRGATWTEITDNLLSAVRDEYPESEPGSVGLVFYDEAEFPDAVFLSVQPPREGLIPLWKSIDKGMTWTKLDQAEYGRVLDSQEPLSAEDMYWRERRLLKDASGRVLGSSRSMAIDPEDPSLVYAGTDTGVCKSTDGGDTWVDASKGIEHEVDGSLRLDPVVPSTMYVAAQEGVFKSDDNGVTWKEILSSGYLDELGNSFCSFALAPSRPSTLYAWTPDGLFRSEDGGETWSKRRGELLLTANTNDMSRSLVAVAPDDPEIVFAQVFTGTGSDLFRSVDGGDSWTVVLENVGHDGLLADPNDPATMYVSEQIEGLGNRFSVAKSVDGGATWRTVRRVEEVVADFGIALGVGDPTPVYTFQSLTPYLATLDAEGGPRVEGVDLADLEVAISRSLDGGASWETVEFVNLPGPIDDLVCDRRSTGVWYVLSSEYTAENGGYSERKVYRSADGGLTWVTAFESMPPGCGGLAIEPGPNGSLYAYGYGGVYRWVSAEDADAEGDPSDSSGSSSQPSAPSSGWGCSGG